MSQVYRGEGGGGGSSGRTPVEAPNTLRSRQTARIIDIISEGEIGGLVSGQRSIFLDDTAVENSDSTTNFDGFSFVEKSGLPDQSPVGGFARVETEVSVAAEVLRDTSISRTISNTDLDAVRVRVRVPALVQATDEGDQNATDVSIAIDLQPDGGSFSQVRTDIISGKTVSPYEREYRIDLTGTGPWTVRMRRLTDDSESTRLRNQTFFDAYTEVSDTRLIYPDLAYVGLTVDSALFGDTIPRRAYEVDGLLIQVPTNYNPVTREYAGVWDGSFKVAFSNNPAWVIYDILNNNRYGLGKVIPAGFINKFELFTIAQYCDQLVEDGKGGVEPRFTFNGVINKQEEAYSVINTVLSSFRGLAYWGSGTVDFAQNSPAAPTRLISNAHVVDGEFEYSNAVSAKERYSTVLVSWTNPELGYQSDIETVEDTTLVGTIGLRTLDVSAFGCTSQGQARRHGLLLLDEQDSENEVVSYRATFDHANVRPGEVIYVADQFYASRRMGGRVATATTTRVTLDSEVTIEIGQTYTLFVYNANGDVQERPVTTGAGTASSLTVAPPLTEAPAPDSAWILRASNLAPRQFRVLSVVESDPGIFQVQGRLFSPTKFDRVESGIFVEDPDFSIVPSGPIPAPPGLSVDEAIVHDGAISRSVMTISCTPVLDSRVRRYEFQARRPGSSEFSPLATQTGVSYDLADAERGVYTFRVRAVSQGNQQSQWSNEVTFNALDYDAPVAPENLALISPFVGTQVSVNWDDASGINAWQVQVIDAADSTRIITTLVDESEFTFSFEQARAAGVSRAFTISVRARSNDLVLGAAATLAVSNPQSAALSGFTVTQAIRSNILEWQAALESDNQGYVLYASQTAGFIPGPGDVLEEDLRQTLYEHPGDPAGGVWYYRVAPRDVWGSDGLNFTSEGSGAPQLIQTIDIEELAITVTKIADNSISTPKLQANSVDANKIQALAITADKIRANAVTSAKILANSVTAAKIFVSQLSAISANLGTVTAGTFRTSAGSGFRTEISSAGAFPLWYGNGAKTAANARLSVDTAGNLTIRNSSGQVILQTGGTNFPNLGLGAFATLDQITQGNVATYIAAAAIRTAQIGDLQVSTLKIQGNAVTIPIASHTSGGINVVSGSGETGSETVLQTASIISTGQHISINWSCAFENRSTSETNMRIRVMIDGVEVTNTRDFLQRRDDTNAGNGRLQMSGAIATTTTPGAHTFQLLARGITAAGVIIATQRFLGLLEVKR